jgi:hypothetical protein
VPNLFRTALLGFVAGLGFLARPYDTFLFCAVLAVAGVYRMGYEGFGALAGRAVVVTLSFLPFLGVQLACNKAVTGHYRTMPWSYYTNTNDPYDDIAMREISPSEEPVLESPTKRKVMEVSREDYMEKISTPLAIRVRDFLGYFVRHTIPNPLFALVLPVGLIGLRGLRLPAVCFFVMVAAGYSLHTVLCKHYPMTVAPYSLILVASTAAVLTRGWGERVKLFTMILLLLPSAFLSGRVYDKDMTTFLDQTNAALAKLEEPSVVFFDTPANGVELYYPTYNTDVAWPDDARVVRVYWQSPEKNRKVLEYYARTQPQRTAYFYDNSFNLTRLGNVAELARQN